MLLYLSNLFISSPLYIFFHWMKNILRQMKNVIVELMNQLPVWWVHKWSIDFPFCSLFFLEKTLLDLLIFCSLQIQFNNSWITSVCSTVCWDWFAYGRYMASYRPCYLIIEQKNVHYLMRDVLQQQVFILFSHEVSIVQSFFFARLVLFIKSISHSFDAWIFYHFLV